MKLAPDAAILDPGCGTGVVTCALAGREMLEDQIVGIDFSSELIDTARALAFEEGVDGQIDFRVGDASHTGLESSSFDAVILHTLISHFPDPLAVVAESRRVVRPGGLIAIFDGDYASITYATGDRELDAEMVRAILDAVVANPYVMREMPSMLCGEGLQMESFEANVLAEAGESAFFSGMAESYVPIVIRSKTAADVKATGWLDKYRETVSANTAFASCNYYSYLARRSD